MRPLLIVVEGQTEKVFVDNCLQPYLFANYGLYDVSARELGIPGSKGGRVAFSRIKFDVELLLKQRGNAIITTLVDYYGMGTDFPDYLKCQKLPFVDDRIKGLEEAIYKAIGSHRFVPYFQKYEFEALLFSAGNPLTKYLTERTCAAIDAVRQEFSGPEEINTGNPPSYRLNDLLKEHEKIGYRKTSTGPILALELGMETILNECPRFANWIDGLAQRVKNND